MWMIAFFGLCVFCFVAGSYAVKDYKIRRDALIMGVLGFLAGFGIEYWGVSSELWAYGETDLFYVTGIPIEILAGYSTGMFLLGLLIYYISTYYTGTNGDVVIRFFPLIGAFFFLISILHYEIPLFVGMSFLAIWGLMISKNQSIVIIVGVTTFFADVIVEGILTMTTEYYLWNVGVSTSFMMMGMLVAGILTRRSCCPQNDFCFVQN